MASGVANREEKLIVAAVDFGTTFSGYAYSFLHDYKRDPLKIHSNHWIGGSHISLKAPTCVLFTPQKVFHSFGYEAEDKYTELAEEEQHENWYYFRRFKMMLHENKTLTRSTQLNDQQMKPMSALTVFAAGIRYLKQHLFEALSKCGPVVRDSDIHWVLTVPAIWNESAKQFMREAAVEAGILGSHLSLALEPEAASMFCQRIPTDLMKGSALNVSAFHKGACYIVLDLGGGTVDITVHKVLSNGSLSELAKASGGAWGGTQVDEAFLRLIEDLVGKQVLDNFMKENTSDFLDMMRDFESKKRKISSNTSGTVPMRLPPSLAAVFASNRGKSLKDHIATTQYSGKITFHGDKVKIRADIVKEFFSSSISNTIQHVSKLLQGKEFNAVGTILLVGGFAESEIVQEKIREAFTSKKVIVPTEAELSVLKGAVLFGHDPKVIVSRISRYTYGVENIDPFIPGVHPEAYKVYDNCTHKFKCKNLFFPFVHAGDEVPVDKVVTNNFLSDIFDCTEGFGVFATPSAAPRYTVELGCFKLGRIKLQEPNHSVDVQMKFGDTEFSVTVTDKNTGAVIRDCFDFLTH